MTNQLVSATFNSGMAYDKVFTDLSELIKRKAA